MQETKRDIIDIYRYYDVISAEIAECFASATVATCIKILRLSSSVIFETYSDYKMYDMGNNATCNLGRPQLQF